MHKQKKLLENISYQKIYFLIKQSLSKRTNELQEVPSFRTKYFLYLYENLQCQRASVLPPLSKIGHKGFYSKLPLNPCLSRGKRMVIWKCTRLEKYNKGSNRWVFILKKWILILTERTVGRYVPLAHVCQMLPVARAYDFQQSWEVIAPGLWGRGNLFGVGCCQLIPCH